MFLNGVVNQLRYPNNHTYYFSAFLLLLFECAATEFVQEQITRVLLERLIVHRPHPWGLLITFIELIKNPRYNFWYAVSQQRALARCAAACFASGASLLRSGVYSRMARTDCCAARAAAQVARFHAVRG